MANTIALVGGDTLLGREIRDVFNESSLGRRLKVVAGDEDETGKVVAIDGGASVIGDLTEEELEDASIVILAGSPETSRRALAIRPTGKIIDVTGTTEEDAESKLRAPLVEQFDPSSSRSESELDGPVVVAHPAAVTIAILLRRLHRSFGVVNSVIQVFEPASERGKPGVEELQQQTVGLLSFQKMPKQIYDAQLSFNLLAQFGEEAPVALAQIEERIERHLASLLDLEEDAPPPPSIRLIQAPVFHGYSFSCWIVFDDAPSPREIEEVLSEAGIDVRGEGVQSPTNAGIVGQNGVAVGAITADRNNSGAVWLWMVADNLRLSAENTARLAMEVS